MAFKVFDLCPWENELQSPETDRGGWLISSLVNIFSEMSYGPCCKVLKKVNSAHNKFILIMCCASEKDEIFEARDYAMEIMYDGLLQYLQYKKKPDLRKTLTCMVEKWQSEFKRKMAPEFMAMVADETGVLQLQNGAGRFFKYDGNKAIYYSLSSYKNAPFVSGFDQKSKLYFIRIDHPKNMLMCMPWVTDEKNRTYKECNRLIVDAYNKYMSVLSKNDNRFSEECLDPLYAVFEHSEIIKTEIAMAGYVAEPDDTVSESDIKNEQKPSSMRKSADDMEKQLVERKKDLFSLNKKREIQINRKIGEYQKELDRLMTEREKLIHMQSAIAQQCDHLEKDYEAFLEQLDKHRQYVASKHQQRD